MLHTVTLGQFWFYEKNSYKNILNFMQHILYLLIFNIFYQFFIFFHYVILNRLIFQMKPELP